jgi:hypothetical protein
MKYVTVRQLQVTAERLQIILSAIVRACFPDREAGFFIAINFLIDPGASAPGPRPRGVQQQTPLGTPRRPSSGADRHGLRGAADQGKLSCKAFPSGKCGLVLAPNSYSHGCATDGEEKQDNLIYFFVFNRRVAANHCEGVAET